MAAEATPALPGGRSLLERPLRAQLPDKLLRWVLTGLAAGILILIGFFFVRLIIEAKPALEKFGVFGFAFDNNWDVSRSIYGALPLVVGTLITSAIALLIGVPIAVAAALFLTELCPRRFRSPLTVLLELLAAVPSVVYGLWGVFVLIPKLKPAEAWFGRTFDFIPFVGPDVAGPNYFIAGLILAIMILPIVSAISREVIATVPVANKEAALAIGATRWEMIRIAVLPYSRSGITGGAMLGLGRAIGETIAITLVIGNAPQIGHTVFSQGYTLAAVIANEFGEAANNQLHRAALIAAGLVLFVLTLVINIIARAIVARTGRPKTLDVGMSADALQVLPPISARRRRTDKIARGMLGVATLIALVPLVLVIYYLLKRGLGAISWHFFSTDPTGAFLGDPGGIKSALLGTIEIVAFAAVFAIPIGIGVALYLVEYGKDGRFASVVRYFVDVMTGVPSIVFGLFVYITLVIGGIVPQGYAAWKGAVALGLLMLPIVTRSAEVVLILVPDSLREAALALGAPRWRIVLRVVLPTAMPGLITGSLLAVARAAGETAPLLFTSAIVLGTNFSLGQRTNSMPIQIFNDVGQAQDRLVQRAWGTALTLVAMILILNMVARLIARRSSL